MYYLHILTLCFLKPMNCVKSVIYLKSEDMYLVFKRMAFNITYICIVIDLNLIMAEESSNKYESLQQSIEEFIETSRQIGIMVSDFQPGCQDVLNTKVNSLIENMQDIEKLKVFLVDVEVPAEIFQYIDQGRNPQLYTKDCLQKVLTKNEEVKGKIDAYKNFKTILQEELKKELPQTMEKHSHFKKQQFKPT